MMLPSSSAPPNRHNTYLPAADYVVAPQSSGLKADYYTDGTADQVQIQAAIDAAVALGGGAVLIKRGTYSISSTITISTASNVWVRGEGMFTTKLVATSGTGTGAIIGNTANTLINPLNNFKLTDMELDGTAMPTTPSYQIGRKGVESNYLVNCTFQNLYIHNTPASGLGIDNLYRVWIDHCYITNCGTAGQTQGSNGVGLGTGGMTHESVIVTNCYTSGIKNSAYLTEDLESVTDGERSYIFANNISVGDKIGFSNSGCRNVEFVNNTIYGATAIGIRALNFATHIADHTIIKGNIVNAAATQGILIDSGVNNYQIEGNIVRNNTEEGIRITGGVGSVVNNNVHNNGKHGILVFCSSGSYPISNVVITSNIVYDNAQVTANTDGIRLDATNANITDVIVANNRCYDDQGSPTQRYGVIVASGTVSNIAVLNNDLAGNKTAGMLVTSTNTGLSIRNNVAVNPDIIYNQGNITGATTFTAVNGTKILATLTGNITVTWTAGVAKGDVMTLELTQDGTGSRTVTWPANFKKAGGTLTLTTTAGAVDVITAMYDGTNWVETSRSLNVS